MHQVVHNMKGWGSHWPMENLIGPILDLRLWQAVSVIHAPASKKLSVSSTEKGHSSDKFHSFFKAGWRRPAYTTKENCALQLTLMLLVAILANTKWCKNLETWMKTCHICTHLRVLARAFYRIPTWQGLDGFQKSSWSCALDLNSLSIGRVTEQDQLSVLPFNHTPLIICVRARLSTSKIGWQVFIHCCYKSME